MGKVQTHRWCGVGLFVREGFSPLWDTHLLQPAKGAERSFPLISPAFGVIYLSLEPRSCFHISMKC